MGREYDKKILNKIIWKREDRIQLQLRVLVFSSLRHLKPKTTNDILRLEDIVSFVVWEENTTRRSKTVSKTGLVLVLSHCRVAALAM